MGARDRFLEALRLRTTAHLEALSQESAELFAQHADLPEQGTRIYARLVERFGMDGAQEIGASLIDLLAGGLEDGAVTLTDREYRGLRLVDEEFSRELPDGRAASLHDLIVSLGRADIR